jgi:uncharacterized protein YbcI
MAETLAGGQLLAAISTAIVGILRDHYGRGPTKAKTYAFDDVITCVLRGTGFTPLEKTLMESGEPGGVLAIRKDFQRVIGERYKHAIEELTGRKVVAFLSEASLDPDITVELFFVDTPLEGFGTGDTGHPEGHRFGTSPVDRRSPLRDRRSSA